MTAAGVGFTELDAGEVMRRWPQWRLADDVRALFQEQSGFLRADQANLTHRRMAQEHDATLYESLPITRITETAAGVEVEAGGQKFRAEKLIIAAGAWSNQVLSHFGVQFPLDVTQEQVVYLHPRSALDFHPSRFPIWIWMDEPCFYGFPIAGRPSVKVAWDRCSVLTTPETRSFEPDQATTETIRCFTRRAPARCRWRRRPCQDLSLHPDPGSRLRHRSGTGLRTVFRRHRRRPRLQVRLIDRPPIGGPGDRRINRRGPVIVFRLSRHPWRDRPDSHLPRLDRPTGSGCSRFDPNNRRILAHASTRHLDRQAARLIERATGMEPAPRRERE